MGLGSKMAHHETFTLSENDNPLNQVALDWLKEAKADAPSHYLHLLNLAHWGLDLEKAVQGEWPAEDRAALKEQVDGLFGWQANNVLAWLFSNPEGESPREQQENLLRLLQTTNSPQRASAHVLNAIYSRQVSQNSALQPAASELS